ncbi:MAG: SH3 domain-containing protein [Alphaproteobacteria bacterium]|nr:SH3 domain-containing protein [Alphaproteobacteria bacterium]
MKYPVKWVYKKLGLPVEIVLEYDAWRKIKDSEGEEGWVHQTLLTGKRTGLVRRDRYVPLYEKPSEEAKLAAQIEPGVIIELKECKPGWCEVNASGYGGWVERQYVWGLYDSENFD